MPPKKRMTIIIRQLLKQYPSFFNQLLKDGPTVMIYDPDDGIYYNRVIGATYAKNEIMARRYGNSASRLLSWQR